MTEAGKEAGAATADEIKSRLGKLPFAEKVLAPIALVVIVGWVVKWSTEGRIGRRFRRAGFLPWDPTGTPFNRGVRVDITALSFAMS